MRILYQGGWRAGRDPAESRNVIAEYCRSLARHTVLNGHQLVLSNTRDYEAILADEIVRFCQEQGREVKDHLLYLLPERIAGIPSVGRVRRFEETRWWIEERTYLVHSADVVIAIGGGRGTFDCVEKALLAGKPVFVAATIPCPATNAWRRRKPSYKYLKDGDADFLDDLNTGPEEFFGHVFSIINSLAETRYSRRVFIVHGRDRHFKDDLVDLLTILGLEPVVLQDEPSKGLTIIEKLERDTAQVGFGFVLYTPDDICSLVGEPGRFRARQNVVFEHGLLIGLLGRDRVCAVIKGDLEIPSDISGMLHEQIDDFSKDALRIARVLKQAGYRLDVSKLI